TAVAAGHCATYVARGAARRRDSMAATGPLVAIRPTVVAVAALGLASVAIRPTGEPARAQSEAAPVPLAPHPAIYHLQLKESHGQRSLEAARGRIVYDFSGNACDGYALKFRQVTELDSGEGKTAVSDLRSETWEEGSGKSFRFASQNYMNDTLVDSVEGR